MALIPICHTPTDDGIVEVLDVVCMNQRIQMTNYVTIIKDLISFISRFKEIQVVQEMKITTVQNLEICF